MRLPRRSGRGECAPAVVRQARQARQRRCRSGAFGPGTRGRPGRTLPRAGAPGPGRHHAGSQPGDVRAGPGAGRGGRDRPDRRAGRHAGLQHPRKVRPGHHHAELAVPPADPRRPAAPPGLPGASRGPGRPVHRRARASGRLPRRRAPDQQRVEQRGRRRDGQRALGRRVGRDRSDHADHQGTRQGHLQQAGRRRPHGHRRGAQPVLDRHRADRRDPPGRRLRHRGPLRGLRGRLSGGRSGRLADDLGAAPRGPGRR